MQHCGIRCLQSHIGAAAHGNADISRSQRWRIVDTITNFGNDLTFITKLTDDALFVFRQKFRTHLDAEILADGFRSTAIVASQHHGANACIFQRLKSGYRISTRFVAHGDGTCNPAVRDQYRNRLAFIVECGNSGRKFIWNG